MLPGGVKSAGYGAAEQQFFWTSGHNVRYTGVRKRTTKPERSQDTMKKNGKQILALALYIAAGGAVYFAVMAAMGVKKKG